MDQVLLLDYRGVGVLKVRLGIWARNRLNRSYCMNLKVGPMGRGRTLMRRQLDLYSRKRGKTFSASMTLEIVRLAGPDMPILRTGDFCRLREIAQRGY